MKRLSNRIIWKYFQENATEIINLTQDGDGSCLDPIGSEKIVTEAEFISSLTAFFHSRIDLEADKVIMI